METTILDGIPINEKQNYSRSEIVSLAKKRSGWAGAGDALALWALAADVRTGLMKGDDILAFQEGTLHERLEEKRKARTQVLPLWRGGPIFVSGHSWAVKKVFNIDVYRKKSSYGDYGRDALSHKERAVSFRK